MLANEFLAFEHSPLFFVDIIIHCSLLRTCRVRVEEKEEFLVYTVLWTLNCHPYLESATALSDYYIIIIIDPQLYRSSSSHTQRPKFHLLLHLPQCIADFGRTASFNSERILYNYIVVLHVYINVNPSME